jgi:hypothetical protein
VDNRCCNQCEGRWEARCSLHRTCLRPFWIDAYGFVRAVSGAKLFQVRGDQALFFDKRTRDSVSVPLAELTSWITLLTMER